MYHRNEIPDVVELNVNGVEHKALLSTLTKDEGSILASMFNGQLPVYTDKKDRYFLEANGSTFGAILHYLSYDEFPTDGYMRRTDGLFGGGFGAQPHFTFGCHLKKQDLKAVYADAVKYRLSSLVTKLEQYEPILMEKKMKEYRQSIDGYEETLNKILSAIPAEAAFYENTFTVRLVHDLQPTFDDKCCDHVCQICYWNFQNTDVTSIDTTVKASCAVTIPFLSALVMDLKDLGYIVQGLESRCRFNCQKKKKQSKYVGFGFGNQQTNCCDENLLLLIFKFGSESHHVTQLAFNPKQNVSGRPFGSGNLFGQPAGQSKGFSFGGGQNTSAFGSAPDSQSNQNCFGSAQNTPSFNFGASPGTSTNQGTFGSTQNTTGFGFGSTQSKGGFGSSQSQHSVSNMAWRTQYDPAFGSSQGFQSPTSIDQVNADSFQQNQGGFFGSAPKQGPAFGGSSQQPLAFGGSSQQQGSVFGGSCQQQGSVFGGSSQQKMPTFSFSGQPQGSTFGDSSQQGPKFGVSSQQQTLAKDVGFGQQQQGSLFGGGSSKKSPSSTETPKAFGQKSLFGSKPPFGISPKQPSAVFGGFGTTAIQPQGSKTVTSTVQSAGFTLGIPITGGQTAKSSLSLSQPPPEVKNTSSASSNVVKASLFGTSQASTQSTTGFSFGPPITSSQSATTSVNPTSSLFGSPVFGGSATFTSPFKLPSMDKSSEGTKSEGVMLGVKEEKKDSDGDGSDEDVKTSEDS
ncbi:hypothetical protein ACF0H5_021141 [Mactra antiquata]